VKRSKIFELVNAPSTHPARNALARASTPVDGAGAQTSRREKPADELSRARAAPGSRGSGESATRTVQSSFALTEVDDEASVADAHFELAAADCASKSAASSGATKEAPMLAAWTSRPRGGAHSTVTPDNTEQVALHFSALSTVPYLRGTQYVICSGGGSAGAVGDERAAGGDRSGGRPARPRDDLIKVTAFHSN